VHVSNDALDDDTGGESACFAHLICPECGVVLAGLMHVSGCTWVNNGSSFDTIAGRDVDV
jgi:hypothetical protein